MKRRIAGWCLLSLIPAAFVALAALAGQLAELAVGAAIAAVLTAVVFVGVGMVTSGKRRRN